MADGHYATPFEEEDGEWVSADIAQEMYEVLEEIELLYDDSDLDEIDRDMAIGGIVRNTIIPLLAKARDEQ